MTGLALFAVCALASFSGYLAGFWQGWRLGRRYGEVDGVAWATNRLEEERKR
jgi:membrane protein DedA with SNARE-associated domain